MGANATERERTRVSIEALALALLAAFPLLPYFLSFHRYGVPRFAFEGDFAGLELATRYVPSGRTLLGPYSRFGFSHPGPLYFYALAPVYALSGGTGTGILAGACAINAAAAMAIVSAVRLAATRAHAIAATLVVLAWLGAFGDACAIPWNPLVVVLPMIAFLVLAALVANGSWPALPFAVIAGAFVAETHLSTIPAVVATAVVTALAVAVRARRGHRFDPHAKRWALAGLVVLVLAIAPPVVEQLVAPTGNLTKLVRFFVSRPDPLRPFASALGDWALATSWLPDRLVSTSLLAEGLPDVMRSEPPLAHVSVTAFRSTVALCALAAVACAVALRRRDYASVTFVGVGALASVVSVLALRAIVGANYTYLLFWTTAATTVMWIGVVSTLATALADVVERSARPALVRVAAAVAVVVTCAVALEVSSLQRGHLARNPAGPVEHPDVREGYAALRARLAASGETLVVHAYGAWHYALALLLEASKDGLDPRIVDRDRWIFGRQPSGAAGVAHPLHVYVQTPEAQLPMRDCLRRLAASTRPGAIEIYTSEIDVEICPARAAPELPPN
jgi:hypothetical protein